MRLVLHLVFVGLILVSLGVRAEDAAVTKRFRDLLASEWETTLRESPTFASHLGDRRYNDRWPDVSLTAIARRHEHQRDVLAQLDRIDREQLSPADRLNYQLYRKEIAEEIEAYPFQWHLVPLNQRGGIQTENELADSLQFTTVKDYEDWIARLRSFPTLMRQTMELMRAGIKERIVQPKVVMARLPQQIRKQIVDEPTESLFYKPLKTFSADIPPAEQERLKNEAAAAIREHVVPAYRTFAKFFDEEYLPACFDEVGAWQLPRGQEFYAVRARHFTTTSMTPEEIHAIGLKEVVRIRQNMEAIVREVEFKGSFQEFLQHLRTDKKFYYDTPEELMNGYLALCKRVDPELTKLFKNLPRIPYGLEPVPLPIAPDTTTAYYRQPSADGRRPGTYFVNLYRPETRPKYEMEALSLHESVPGHHLQLALQAELGELPPFRRYGGFTAFVEGWGLYSESLGDELGCYKDPYSRFGQLTYEMWRAVRLVVDTGMHAKKWTRQQAIGLFKENTAKTELDIVNEVDRYIAWPGQALAYKIGELKIKELRARAKAKLGDKFDVREFHDVVLRQGAVPLDVLEGIVDEWLSRRQVMMNASMPHRIAMWSGPRNISTAMMRSWGNRDDCVVVDEPLYAHFLHVTRKPHPGIEESIAAGDTDWRKVVAQLTGPIPGGKSIYFQKHMTHHLLPEMEREWIGKLTNCFLIRNPREVLASYTKVIETPTLEDLGFPQQTEIFAWVKEHTGRTPPVLDAADVLRDPRRMLGQLCDAIGIEFQNAMLSWPPGKRETDGIWGKYWYGEVEKSTGFRPYHAKEIHLPPTLERLSETCLPFYERLYEHRLR